MDKTSDWVGQSRLRLPSGMARASLRGVGAMMMRISFFHGKGEKLMTWRFAFRDLNVGKSKNSDDDADSGP